MNRTNQTELYITEQNFVWFVEPNVLFSDVYCIVGRPSIGGWEVDLPCILKLMFLFIFRISKWRPFRPSRVQAERRGKMDFRKATSGPIQRRCSSESLHRQVLLCDPIQFANLSLKYVFCKVCILSYIQFWSFNKISSLEYWKMTASILYFNLRQFDKSKFGKSLHKMCPKMLRTTLCCVT